MSSVWMIFYLFLLLRQLKQKVKEMLESKFKTQLSKEIKKRLPGSMVLHLDPTEIQGVPDLIVLYGDRWAALEGKRSATASHRPNQDYYVKKMNEMGFARFIYPENKEDVLNDMERSLAAGRKTRTTRSK